MNSSSWQCFEGSSGLCSIPSNILSRLLLTGGVSSSQPTVDIKLSLFATNGGGSSSVSPNGAANGSGRNSEENVDARHYVCLDSSRAGDDVVILRNGLRICGTGAALANAPIVQDKAYFEFKVQSSGTWGVGVASANCDPNRIPLGNDSFSCMLHSDGCIHYEGRIVAQPSSNHLVEDGDVIGISYDHTDIKFYIKPTSTVGSSSATATATDPILVFSGLRGTLFPAAFVANGATLDAQFSRFSLTPPPGFGRLLIEQTLFS